MSDVIETPAIKQAFGDRAPLIPVNSTKALHRHLKSAAGTVELIATILANQNQVIPPTAHYKPLDTECDLDFVPNEPRPPKLDAALSNSFAFGGLIAVIAVKTV